MAFFSGASGKIVVDGTPDIDIHVTDWSLQANNRLAEVTTSATTSSLFLPTLFDNSWSCSLPVDAAATPSDAGLVPGAIVTVWFKLGSTTEYHRLVNTTIESVGVQNQNTGDAHRNTISGRGGVLTMYTAIS